MGAKSPTLLFDTIGTVELLFDTIGTVDAELVLAVVATTVDASGICQLKVLSNL